MCRRGLTGVTTPTLRDGKGRTESSGNVCSNWGYLAEERKTDCVNQRGVGVRRDRIWLPETEHRSEHSNGEYRKGEFLLVVNPATRPGQAFVYECHRIQPSSHWMRSRSAADNASGPSNHACSSPVSSLRDNVDITNPVGNVSENCRASSVTT